MKNKNRIQLLLLILSMIIGGAGTCMCARRFPVCSPAPLAQMAWWGGIYPEYCLSGAMEAVGEGDTDSARAELQVKVCFKYLTFLNE